MPIWEIRVNLYFPAHGDDALDQQPHDMSIPHGNGERILVVDDEEILLVLARRMLTRLGYFVETMTLVKDALDLVRAEPDRFDLVITDLTMPVMSGIAFAQELARMRPNLPVILTTGYLGSLRMEQMREMGIRRLLAKPFSIQSLGTIVHGLLTEKND
jgi:CheY-like chemotaxis protein